MSEVLAKSEARVAADTPAAAPVNAPAGSIASKVITIHWPTIWVAVISLAAVVGFVFLRFRPEAGVGYAYALAVLVCVIAALTDAATGLIPNKLTYPAIVAGVGMALLAAVAERTGAGWAQRAIMFLSAPTVRDCLIGFGVCAGIGIISWLVSGMGEGDLKLLCALGAILGLGVSMKVLLLALCVAVPYAVINIVISGKFNEVICEAAWRIMQVVAWGKLDQRAANESTPVMNAKKSIPLAVPILIGLIAWQVVPASWLAPITG